MAEPEPQPKRRKKAKESPNRDVVNTKKYDDRKFQQIQRNRFKGWKRTVKTNILKKKPTIPFVGVEPDYNNDAVVDNFACLLLSQKGMDEYWLDEREMKKIKREVNDVTANKSLSCSPIESFYAEHLPLLSLTHSPPTDWSVDPLLSVMGFVPKDLLDSAMHFVKGRDCETLKVLSERKKCLNHVEPGAGWYRFLGTDKYKQSPSVDSRLNRLLDGFKRMFVRSITAAHEQDETGKLAADAAERRDENTATNVNVAENCLPSLPTREPQWTVNAAIVVTDKPCPQLAHLDYAEHFAPDTWLVHIPLQRDGSMVSLFDETNKLHRYVYVPFGSYLAIRSDVWHSGLYGNPGNVRLHVVLTTKALPKDASLLTPIDPEDALEAIRPRCHKEFFKFHAERSHRISQSYVDLLTEMNFCDDSEDVALYTFHDAVYK